MLEEARRAADRVVEVLALDALGVLAAGDGRTQDAVSAVAAADEVAAAAPYLWAGDRVDRDRVRRD